MRRQMRDCKRGTDCSTLLRADWRTDCAAQHAGAKRQRRTCSEFVAVASWCRFGAGRDLATRPCHSWETGSSCSLRTTNFMLGKPGSCVGAGSRHAAGQKSFLSARVWPATEAVSAKQADASNRGIGMLANVRAKLPAEAGAVSLVRDDAPCAADQAYSACRSGSA
jgi:hypothetical protein